MMSSSEASETTPKLKPSGPEPTRPAVAEPAPAKSVVVSAERPFLMTFVGILTVLGAVAGWHVAEWYVDFIERKGYIDVDEGFFSGLNLVCITVIGMLLGFLLGSVSFRQLWAGLTKVEQMPLEDKIAGLLGVILGLVVAVLLTPLVSSVRAFSGAFVAIVYLFSVGIGVLFTISMKKEVVRMFAGSGDGDDQVAGIDRAKLKLLDTNVIIDGRLLEVWSSGFIEGELLLPEFVLEELQLIADSADDLKRARGRRGLDLLNKMREEVDCFRILAPRDYGISVDDEAGVDGKLIRLASNLDAALVTNDYNLSRVADVHGIQVLNINRLALALKPVVIAGEEMTVNIIRAGRDPGQGVAYLDDGTMVVVEDGEPKIGKVVDVVVTSHLQTVAGKMIFAILKNGDSSHGHHGGRNR